MGRRKLGWNKDLDLDLEEPKPKKTKADKKTKTKKSRFKKEEPEDDDLDLFDLLDAKPSENMEDTEADIPYDDIEEDLDLDLDEDVEEKPVEKKPVKKRRKRRTRNKTDCSVCGKPQYKSPSGVVCDEGHGGAPSTDDIPFEPTNVKTEKAAEKLDIDLSMECPVCRSIEGCECEEEDRAFVRRVRFEHDVKKVACCRRCQAPLSVIYQNRPGTKAPFQLSHFVATYACAQCNGDSLAVTALNTKIKESS